MLRPPPLDNQYDEHIFYCQHRGHLPVIMGIDTKKPYQFQVDGAFL